MSTEMELSTDDQRVLFVDDEEAILEALEHCAFDEEWEMLTAGSGPEALEVLSRERVAVVVSDYRMPGMNGVDLLRQVHERFPRTIRMILSGYAEAHVVVEAINEGHVDRFLAKPWDDEELIRAVNDGIHKYVLELENEQLQETVKERNKELSQLNQQLKLVNETLEHRVKERTATLEAQNLALVFAQEVLHHLPYALYGVDTAKRLMLFNDAAMVFPGCACPPQLGDSMDGVLPEEVTSLMDRVIQEKRFCSRSFEIQEKQYMVDCVPLGDRGSRGVIAIVMRTRY